MPQIEKMSNGVICISVPELEENSLQTIVKNTKNTWQKDRTIEEKAADSRQGKLAEIALAIYFREESELVFVSYDEFRSDGREKSAPTDGLIFSSSNLDKMTEVIKLINTDVEECKGKYGNIKDTTRNKIRGYGVKFVEIKSTKIATRHGIDEYGINYAINKIINEDDFLYYPIYVRNSDSIDDTKKFLDYISKKYSWYNVDKWRDIEKNKMDEINIRVYTHGDKAYILGYIEKEEFCRLMEIKKMPLMGKSEHAVYLAVSLKERKLIEELG